MSAVRGAMKSPSSTGSNLIVASAESRSGASGSGNMPDGWMPGAVGRGASSARRFQNTVAHRDAWLR